jgi:hypothetical protein
MKNVVLAFATLLIGAASANSLQATPLINASLRSEKVIVGGGVDIYDEDFWSGFDDELPYNHTWKDIPDLVNKTEINWWFNLTH